MKPSDFETLQQSTQAVFSTLYLVDVDLLSAPQRQQHQAALSAAYLAYVKTENTAFAALNEPVKQQLADLLPRLQQLRQGVSKLADPLEQMNLAVDEADVLSQLVTVLNHK